MCASCQGTFWAHKVTTGAGWSSTVWDRGWLSDLLDQYVVSVAGVALRCDHFASTGDGMMVVSQLITAMGASTRYSFTEKSTKTLVINVSPL